MLIIETQYFPSIHFFALLAQSGELCIEKHENYIKQTYRNRCYILGANKIERLTVPVFRAEKGEKQLITDAKLDNRTNWQQIHWRSIRAAYGKSPFFPYYADMIESALFMPTDSLFQLNENILTVLLKIVSAATPINTKINYTNSYQKSYEENFIIDKRNQIVEVNEINFKPYSQVFGNEFVSNLSVLDLIFCKVKYLNFDVL
jgi:hypothetical protein